MSQLISTPRLQAFDAAGDPLVGGLVYFYESGTSTPKNTYSDAALTSANANPVVLDARGEAQVYGSGQYKVVLKDSDNVEIYTTDTFYFSDAGLREDLVADSGSSIIGFIQSGTGAVPRTTESKVQDIVSSFDFMTTAEIADVKAGTLTLDVSAALQTGVDALANLPNGGTLHPSTGKYRGDSPLAMKRKVNVIGAGWDSMLVPNGCDGITFDFTLGYGSPTIGHLSIEGVGTSTNTAIKQISTLDDAVQIHGIHIDTVGVRSFNTAMEFSSVFELEIQNCWLQDINSGINLIGGCFAVGISNNRIIKAAGSGTGTSNAVYMDDFNFTSGSGLLRPEGVRLTGLNHIHGFDYGVRMTNALSVILDGADIQAKIEGIQWTNVASVLTIVNAYVEINGSSASAAIRGTDLAAAEDTKINIKNTLLIASNSPPASAIGVLIGLTGGTGNQDNVTIEDNEFRNFELYDIAIYNSGHFHIKKNSFYSSNVSASIFIEDVPSGRVSYIDGNDCLKDIVTTVADIESGDVVLGTNVVNGTTVDQGDEYVPTVASASALTLGVGCRAFTITGTTAITSIVATGWTGKEITLIFTGALTFTDGSNLKLAGNLSTGANTTCKLFCDGTDWYEISRSVN